MAGAARPGVQAAALCLVQFIDVLGVTSAITAIPAMLAGVGASPSQTGIVATAYAMFFGGLLVLGARLGDRYGHRTALLAGTLAFALVAVVGATAHEVVQLVAARSLQGAAAAVSVPCALRLLLDASATETTRRSALAAWSASGAAAGAAGYLVGGLLTEVFSWRAVFWINTPVGLLLLITVLIVVPRSTPDSEQPRLDLTGAALLVVSVMGVIVGASLMEKPSSRLLGVLVAVGGLALAAGFLAQQRRAEHPLIPPAAMTSVNLRTGTAISFVNTATTSSAGVLAMLLLQHELGATAVEAGLVLIPFSLAVIGGSALCKPLGARLTVRHLAAAGLAGIGAGNLLLALTYGSITGIVVGVIVAGAGLGVASVAATTIGTNVTPELSGSATGLLNTGAQLGTALGVAALLVLATTISGPIAGTAVAWGIAAAVAALSAVSLLVRRHDVEGSPRRLPRDRRAGRDESRTPPASRSVVPATARAAAR